MSKDIFKDVPREILDILKFCNDDISRSELSDTEYYEVFKFKRNSDRARESFNSQRNNGDWKEDE